MSDKTPGIIRTITPVIVGSVIARVIPGIDPTDPTVLLITSTLLTSAYYVAVRYLEEVNPKLGYLLGVAKKPAYSSQPAPSPDSGQAVVAVVVPEDEGVPEFTDNSERDVDPPQDVDQSPVPWSDELATQE